MALADKKYERMFIKEGNHKDKVSTVEVAEMKADYDNQIHLQNGAIGRGNPIGVLVYQIQLLQDEVDSLRTEISANKDKATNVTQTSVSGNAGTVTNGVYTTGTQTIAGAKTFSTTIIGSVNGNSATTSETTITNTQASAITANSLKASFAGASKTTLAFGDMVTTKGKEGDVFTIVLTATTGKVVKSTTLTLA